MKDYPSTKGHIMIIRILGKIFLYFYVIPEVARVTRTIVIPDVARHLTKLLEESEEVHVKNLAKSRMNHPAGSKLDD